MDASWIAVWKAWLLRGAELFAKPLPLFSAGGARRVSPARTLLRPLRLAAVKPAPHRRGQRHG